MSVSALVCPNCGAPLDRGAQRCAFCHVELEVTERPASGELPPGAPGAAGTVPAAGPPGDPAGTFSLTVEDVFSIKKRGTVVTGRVQSGTVRVGDALVVDAAGGGRHTTCTGIEQARSRLDVATAGDQVGLLLDDIEQGDVRTGDRLRHA
jgi:hypothetical protein